ncbi:hypothetical protein [Kaistia adipata]|uniref:hypothetical protein n=1 Tax=Kaistia adipata TaxID=166954 RepID=UPI0003FB27D5|nr:hypothetical protein [Kaistia adipata]
MPYFNDRILDNGLQVLDTEANQINICSAEPATYTAATAANSLGSKAFSAGAAFGSPSARSPSGRKVTSAAITDGSVNSTGTVTHWAVVDTVNSRLLAAGSVNNSQVVTAPNPFTLAAFDIGLPGIA